MSTFNNSADALNTIQYDISGKQDPTIEATQAAPGSTFRKISIPVGLFIKLDEGKTTNWLDLFKSGIATGVNLGTGAQILKNVISNTFYFRSLKNTDSQLIISQGMNEISINANTNELRYPISLITTTNDYETFWAYTMPLKRAEKIGIKVVGQKADKSEFCLFERVGLFYNPSGVVTDQRVWQVLSSFRSNELIDIRYQIAGDNLQIQVKSLDSANFHWKGEITQMSLEVP